MSSTFSSKYTVVDKIGEGSFSEVLKCQERLSAKCYAAKKLKKTFKNPYEVANCAEIIAMNKLAKHPNVVYMVEFHYDVTNGKLVFIFELMDMSMYDYVKMRKRRISEPKVKNFLYQILKGLDHLHSHGIFHRDIKPENILVKLAPPPTSMSSYQYNTDVVKLADLGSIRGIYSKPPYTEYISTRWYRSPECLLTVGYYGPKMDIWAAGCVFYEMLMLKPLFPGHDEIDQLAKIHEVLGTPNERMLRKLKKNNFPKQVGTGLKPVVDKVSDEAVAILKLMVQYDPDLRINVRRLLDHKFFRSLRDEDLFQKFKLPSKDFSCEAVSSGNLPNHMSLKSKKYNKYKTSSSRSSERSEKKHYIPLMSKTNTDILEYKAQVPFTYSLKSTQTNVVSRKQMKAEINPKLLFKTDEKTKLQLEHQKPISKVRGTPRAQRKYATMQQFSKTMSNLDQGNNTKASHFHSKSLVIPTRHTMAELKVESPEARVYKTNEGNLNRRYRPLQK